MTKVAVYIRVSTEEQAKEGFSLDAQKQVLTDYCEALDYEIYKIYVDDGYSGRNTRRPAYRQMMDDINEWDSILVLKMDRIHRNTRNFIEMMDRLNKKDKNFVSKNETLNTKTPTGRFVMQLIEGIAQLESEQIGERTRDGMRQKAETLETSDSEKKTMGFTPPFGYTITDGKLSDVPEEQVIVREIFSMYSNGETMDYICFTMNRNGDITRKGNPWNKYNLRNVLHNPVYAGFMRWDDILIRHDASAVISPSEFNEIQHLMASKVRDPSKRHIFTVPE